MNNVGYACHKCGGTIEEGTAFCPHCGAPQIRVAVPETEQPSYAPGTPAEMQPPAQPVSLSPQIFQPSETAVRWRQAIVPTAVGAFVILVGAVIPVFGLFLKLLIISGGAALAVSLYRRRAPGAPVTGTVGAKLGSATALLSYLVVAIMLVLGCLVDSAGLRQQFVTQFQQMQGQLTDPTSRATAQEWLQKITTPEGFAAFITASLALSFFIFLAFGLVGGVISGSLNRRRQ